MAIADIEDVIKDVKDGKMVIIVDDEDRENEGDVMIAAEKTTPEAINFMARYARGLICLSLSEQRVKELDLPLMVSDNTSPYNTAFTVSIEAREGVTTGISAYDRARTILTAIDPDTKRDDLVRPGHVFPLMARSGGVLFRVGHTEASMDFARLAGLKPAGVICEIMKDDGTMARLPDLEVFTEKQIALVDAVIEALAKADARTVSTWSHMMLGWALTEMNETIPYETIFLTEEPLNEIDILRGLEVAKEFDLLEPKDYPAGTKV